ncbi:DUF1036 domain-containing protein [Aquabacter spiritensis]|uniref:Putative membrane protein n=1 Tax=Aquabacter spiritensis TaxID=933073 RepID=A0A4V2UYC0_9HYPH|nr:DUF1036 domain-containing protein [Aquabacter spiritensis]TCT06808.1 putative membrane protein [Aquabacter spiritensis]
MKKRRHAAWAPLLGLALSLGSLAVSAVPAAADFRLCNRTQSRVGVAVGYKDNEIWITEGWWNVAANTCETLLRGDLVARFYYLYAVDYDQGGEWSGRAFMCTRDKEFTIRGIEDCLARGFDRTGFMEVDTKEQRGWTVQLTEKTQVDSVRPSAVSPIPGGAPMPTPNPAQRSKTP